MCFRILSVAFLFMSCAVSTDIHAATWRVAKDGSGDFTVIQDAVDAAADGDTIEIGPGRYADFTWEIPGGWSIARVEDKSLTFIGSGTAETYLGPEAFGDVDDNDVYCILVLGEGLITRIRDITCENVVYWGVRIEGEGRVEIDDCEFRNSSGGVFGVLRDGGWIRNCRFIDNNTDYWYESVILYTPSVGVAIENCLFQNCYIGFCAYWSGCEDITVRDCTFVGGTKGAGFTDGASGAIIDCEFSGLERYGIVGNSPGTVRIEGNVIDQTGMPNSHCLSAYWSPGNYILRNNIFSSDAVILNIIRPNIGWDCEQNHFLRTGPQAWYVWPATSSPYVWDPVHMDFSNNWWGTDDPDEVSAWIFDGNDDPQYHYFIDFLPMADGSVPVQARSWSEVKGMFGE